MAKKHYDHQQIEAKWLEVWEERKLFLDTAGANVGVGNNREILDPLYLLIAFAYPSGSGLHVGHVESKTALDILARFNRMQGKNVFFPVGWDAFGLPAENYAIKTGTLPQDSTADAITNFRKQLKRIAISYDWANEIATCNPDYYRWTQWIFLQLFKNGLAFQSMGKVNWCPKDQTVLANEQVVDGKCERCGSEVIQKDMKQWYFKITDYKDELIEGLDGVDWPHATKQQQINWIGKSKGLSIGFTHQESSRVIPVWTKYWETVFGVTFLVVSPEKFEQWEMIEDVPEDRKQSVLEYLEKARKKTEEERKIGKDKTGVETGIVVTNPANGDQVPIFIADYVLEGVGTGAVMGVPAHDERDFEFAKKFDLPIKQVVAYADPEINHQVSTGEKYHAGEGTLINSGEFDGLSGWQEGKEKMAKWMVDEGFAGWETTYKLRDWLISRQRYWGAPIPIVYDPQGQPHPVKEEHLPWELPTDVDFKPTGESPLKSSVEFKKRVEDLYGEGWTPEYDTMDTFVDSSWYFLRYVDSKNDQIFAGKEQLEKWLPVDFYMIGPEHTVLHLLYSRFFTKFLRDQGYLNFDEPFMKMRHQGMILGPDGKKMSKSKGNVINPDDVVDKFGADTLRVYEMFMGPIEADKPWDERSAVGVHKFLRRIFELVTGEMDKEGYGGEVSGRGKRASGDGGEAPDNGVNEVKTALHQTIKKVSEDIPDLKFNTAISTLMKFINVWSGYQGDGAMLDEEDLLAFTKLLAPFAPFIAEELWHIVNNSEGSASIHESEWPFFDPELAKETAVVLPIQINGKVRDQLEMSAEEFQSLDKSQILSQAKEQENVQKWLEGKTLKNEIYVPGKIINFVVGD